MVTINKILQKLLDTIPSAGCQSSYIAHLELIKYFADKLEAPGSQQASCESSQDWIPASIMPEKHDNIEIVLGTGEIFSGKVTEIEHGSRLDLLIVNKDNHVWWTGWWTGLEPGVARQTRVKWRPIKS